MNSTFNNGSYSQKISTTPRSQNKFPQMSNQSIRSSKRHNFDLTTPNMNLKSIERESHAPTSMNQTMSNMDIANQLP